MFSAVAAVVGILIARFAPNYVSDFLLRFIGFTSMLYPVNDVYRTVVLNSQLPTDAKMLADSVGGNTVVWGLIWMLVSLIIIGLTLKASLKIRSKKD